MAAGDLNIALILKLVDQATGPARAVTNSLRQIGAVTEETGRAGVAWANEQLAANQARRSALMGEAFGVAALAGSLAASLKPAIEFESSMAGVEKVLDFDTPAGLEALEDSIIDLTTDERLPMAAEGIAAIIEAAGQAGVVDKALPDDQEREQLIAFARSAAQMGVAFGISADEAGSAMAQWRAAMGLSQERSLVLGDAINRLSNNMNAAAPGLVDVIRRQGAVAMTAGLAETEVAALSAAFLSGGASPEIAATALKNFTGALTDGEAMTSRQRAVMQELGFDAVDLAQRMQVDARGAIIDVMEALAELPDHAQGAALTQLFGEESKGAIAPLLTNLDLLRGAFELVEDQAAFSGSMLEEYAKQSATTANALKVTTNFLKAMAITVGSIVLPEINEMMGTLQPLLATLTDWAEAHPELISMIFKLTAGLLFFRLGSIALRWVLFSMLTPILQIIRAASWLLVLLPRLGRALLALLNPMKLVRGALIAIRLAFLATGIGALLAGVAMAGIWIYNNWEGLQTFFVGFWRTFREALGPAAPMLDAIIDYARQIWEWFTNLLGPMDATEEQWLSWGQNAGEALGQVVGNVARWIEENKGLIGTVAKLYAWFFALRLIWRFPMAPIRTAGSVIAWLWRGPVMWLFGGLRQLGRAFLWLGRMAPLLMRGAGMAIAWVATGPIKWLLSGVGLIAKAFIRLGLLMLTNPIGLIIAGVAILAKVVYDNWDKIVSFFIEKVDAVKAAFDEGLLNGVFKLLAEFNPFTLAIEGMQGLVAYVMDLLGVPEEIVAAFREFDLFETGAELLKGLWDGMASLVPQMVAAISDKLSGIVPDWMQDAWNWVTGAEDAPEVSVPSLSETAEFAALPQEQQNAVRTIESIGPVLPTEGYQLELQLREDELRRQIADLQASMTPPPEALAYVQELQNAQADLSFAQELISEARAAGDQTELATLEDEARALEALIANRQAMIASLTENGTQGQELARLETELAAVIERQAQAKTEADALTQALMVINETDVRPDIDTAAIDEALVKARRLSALLQNSSGVAAASAANPDGARDRGGPVRAGMPYLVGERSPEIFVPGVSGTILPGRVLKAAMAASAMAAPVAAMPSQAEIVETLDRRPVMSAPAAAPQITREGDTVTINIYPTQGMSVEDIGREVERRLARREDARRADLHDGVDY